MMKGGWISHGGETQRNGEYNSRLSSPSVISLPRQIIKSNGSGSWEALVLDWACTRWEMFLKGMTGTAASTPLRRRGWQEERTDMGLHKVYNKSTVLWNIFLPHLLHHNPLVLLPASSSHLSTKKIPSTTHQKLSTLPGGEALVTHLPQAPSATTSDAAPHHLEIKRLIHIKISQLVPRRKGRWVNTFTTEGVEETIWNLLFD